MEVATPMKMTAKDRKMHEEYQLEDDMRTLARANEIKNDKTRMRKVKAFARKRMKDMETIASA